MAWNEQSPGRPTKRQFAQLFADELRRLGETAPLRFDEATFTVVRSDPLYRVVGLNNIHRDYVKSPSSGRQEVLRRHVQLWFRLDDFFSLDYADAKTNLLPRVKSHSFSHRVDLEGQVDGRPGELPPESHFAEHLAVQLVYDRPGSPSPRTRRGCSAWPGCPPANPLKAMPSPRPRTASPPASGPHSCPRSGTPITRRSTRFT